MARFKKNSKPKKYKTPIFIKILDRFQKLFTKFGVNYQQLRLIVDTKIMMDSRIDTNKPDPLNNKRKEGQNKYLSSVIMDLFPGIFFAVLLFLPMNPFSQFGLIFSGIAIMLTLVFIQAFSGLFLNPRDREVLGVRGVDDQTLSVSRLVYLSYYVLLLSVPLILPSFIVAIIKTNILAAIIFLIMAFILVIICLILTAVLYYLILSHFTAERLKRMIGLMQTLMLLIMIMIFYLPSVLQINNLNVFSMNLEWYYFLIFPIWFAAPVVMAATFSINSTLLILFGLAIVLPILMVLVYRKISPKFDGFLSRLTEESDDIKRSNGYLNFTDKLFNKNKVEQAYYRLAYKILQTDQNLKMKLYPFFVVGYLVLGVTLLGISRGIAGDGNQNVQISASQFLQVIKNNGLISLISFAPIFGAIFSALGIEQSSQAKSFSVLNSTPTSNPALFYRAALKAFLAKIIIPISLISDLVALPFISVLFYPVLLSGNVVTFFTFIVISRLFLKKVPFNAIENPGKNAANSVKGALGSIFVIYLAMAYGAVAYFFPLPSLAVSLILLVLGLYLMYHINLKDQQFYYE